ncbi:hypothetical protein ACQ4M3_13365 [Leptolyngbya sp. AN03gr2]|uniref:hypothetical protein n=1 Tax=unclassified Leptolyngbya TaxID=2650499 RepID=UPI003D321624
MPHAYKTEEELRRAIEKRLRAWQIPYEREVNVGVGNLRADIVTSDTVIEIKRVLTRSEIYQAKGQGLSYCTHLNRSRLVIIGQAPVQQSAYIQSLNIRSAVTEPHVQIVFLDREPWKLNPSRRDINRLRRASSPGNVRRTSSLTQTRAVLALVGLIALIFVAFNLDWIYDVGFPRFIQWLHFITEK